MNDASISLNKYISNTGVCSRREADRWIEAGRVRLNGIVAQKGNRVGSGDVVTLDGRPLGTQPKRVYIALHKPPGITCTTDQRDPTNIVDFVGYPERIFPIGRLDKPSSGLILLTNDGDIVNKILREENQHEKEYIVRVDRPLQRSFQKRMQTGIHILGTITKPCKVELLGERLFKIILTQGLNRQIRRMCENLGYKVVTLKRVRIMHLTLGNLPKGKWRQLSPKEIQTLQAAL